ncbi:MAG: hypothetical protein ACR2QO_00280 [Acidimicrobiales bacterium]
MDGAEPGTAVDRGGVPAGRLLVDYAEAVVRGSDEIARLRADLIEQLGPDATGHAAATVTAFSGLVRVADGTGIPIDDGLAAVSVATRDELDLQSYGGAANSAADVTARDFTTVEALFDNAH